MHECPEELYDSGIVRDMSIHNSANIMYDPAIHENNLQPVTPSPPPGIMTANHFRASYGYHVRRPMGARDWLLTFTVDGVGRYRLADKLYYCKPGDVILVEPGIMHDYATAEQGQRWEFYWAHFLPRPHWIEWMQLPEQTAGLRGITIVDPQLQQRMVQTFRRLLDDLRNPSRLHGDLAANALEEVLLCIALHNMAKSVSGIDPRVDCVLKYLNDHYREAVAIDDLAQLVSLSASRLAHLFKEQVGRSIIETILAIRLQQAARLLEFSPLTISEIAQEVGFQSSSYLSRQFTAYYGTSPQAYRKSVER